MTDRARGLTRRDVLATAAGAALASVIVVRPVGATPATMQEAIGKVVGAGRATPGRVKLELPPLVENGNAVPLVVKVDSPMTAVDHVRAIHVFAEKNPQPNVVSVFLGPRAGRATISTRMRLADTQTVVALAELSDGSFWTDRADVVVTLAACLEDP